MCHHTATLAQSDECKFISCCEHNMIHVVWNRSRISLTHNEVQRLTSLLEQCWNEIEGGGFYDSRFLRYAPDGYFELGLGDLILRLKRADVYRLTSILRQSLDRLDGQSPRVYALAVRVPKLSPPERSVFSRN